MIDSLIHIINIPHIHMWITLGIILATIIAYTIDKIPLELSSIVTLSVLLLFFHLVPLHDIEENKIITTEHILMGFANPALIAVISLLILGEAVVQTGALNEISSKILKLSRNNGMLAITLSLITVLIVSSFLNNTPIVVIFIPILSSIARKMDISVSKVMIPLSYIAISGGMITLIGSSTNLLVSGMLHDLHLEPLNFFDFTLPGSIMAAIALLYILIIAPKLLPDRASLVRNLAGDDSRQFIAQIEVDYTSELIGQPLDTGHFPNFKDITIRMVQRGEHAFLPPFEENTSIRAGDIIIIGATRKDLTKLIAEKSVNILPHLPGDLTETDETKEKKEDISMAEIVISPTSQMIGKNLEQVAFHHNHNCIVLGIQRQSRIIRARVTEIRLAPGDVLLILGRREDVITLHNSNDILLMEWSTEDIHSSAKGVKAAAIFFAVAGLAALDIVPITISAIAGVSIILLTGCLNLRQTARAIDMKIILLVGTSLALGTALQATGGAAYLAHNVVNLMEGASPQIIMSALFLLMIVITNILSNNASAVLFTPIAVGIAAELGVDPTMFIFAVIFACNCSFMTPIGYQTNLLVMGPGHYRFSDFLRAGLPLAIIMWISYTTMTILYPGLFGL